MLSRRWGRSTSLVTCAGVALWKPALEVPEEEFELGMSPGFAPRRILPTSSGQFTPYDIRPPASTYALSLGAGRLSRPIFDRAAIGTRGGNRNLLALRNLAQRLVDKIPGALQVLEPRRGLVVDAALVDECSFAVDHVHMRGGAGAVRVPDFARGIEQHRGGRRVPIGRELIRLLWRDIARLAGRRRDHRQPHHVLPRPFLLQRLHVVAAIMFAHIRTFVAGPFERVKAG